MDSVVRKLSLSMLTLIAAMAIGVSLARGVFNVQQAKRFSQPLTGDEKVDFINSRTKRIFDDPVGRHCGDHGQVVLMQIYRHDTGEIMLEISAPVYVKGKHWGGFRIGCKTEMQV